MSGFAARAIATLYLCTAPYAVALRWRQRRRIRRSRNSGGPTISLQHTPSSACGMSSPTFTLLSICPRPSQQARVVTEVAGYQIALSKSPARLSLLHLLRMQSGAQRKPLSLNDDRGTLMAVGWCNRF
ncbi:hypothetical protein B0T25DRAFT_343323 [Lasiosphaeria hispida]|uniref:Uncharacterized protein n=1 Tax=Lasiosphaeria hispida TaxID=260671 RepID=A0AAJ0H6D2_9PEZI|nr:hypothetical protein B0T25DRAFT_343323 [Lasiosphaeria hispida]